MKKSHDANLTILFRKKSDNAFSIEELFKNILNCLKKDHNLQIERIELPHSGSGITNKLKNLIFVYKRRKSWIHVSGEVYYTVLLNRKVIITIHDIALALKGNFFKRNLIGLFWYKIPCRIARIITVVSETSKQELIRYTKVNPNKIRVIPNPINEELKYTKGKEGVGSKILAIGTKSNKNLERLIEACAGLRISLHIIGKLTENQQLMLEKHSIDFTNDYGISFKKVIQHYKQCDLVCFVSTYEGFGLPILEAQAIGRAVLTSNISSMPEVAGEGALLVDPYSLTEIRNGIKRLMQDEKLREKLISAGKKNLDKYQLERIVEQYAMVYKELF